MWFMPSYGRPERLKQLLEAPGGWPEKIIVLVNADDPKIDEYWHEAQALESKGAPWRVTLVPSGSRCADAHRYASKVWPDEPFYGLLCDDQWPITPGWHEALVKQAGKFWIAGPNGTPEFPRLRTALVLGGDLVRAMGSLVPAPVKHNFEDDIWDQVAEDFGLLRALPEMIVQHRHWIRGEAKKDATYLRGSADMSSDAEIYRNWIGSQDRMEMNERIAKLIGVKISQYDFSKVVLAVCVPMHDFKVDVALDASLYMSLGFASQYGLKWRRVTSAGGSHPGKARERMLWNAYYTAAGDAAQQTTHFLLVDYDMGWHDARLIANLIASEHEFTGAVGMKKQEPVQPACNFYPGNQTLHPVTNFLKVPEIGFGLVVLKRSVIDKMIAGYPELEYEAGPRREWAFFLDMLAPIKGSKLKARLSEDLSFCHRWGKIGGDIWIDQNAELRHAGRKEYVGRVSDFFTRPKPEGEVAEQEAAE